MSTLTHTTAAQLSTYKSRKNNKIKYIKKISESRNGAKKEILWEFLLNLKKEIAWIAPSNHTKSMHKSRVIANA